MALKSRLAAVTLALTFVGCAAATDPDRVDEETRETPMDDDSTPPTEKEEGLPKVQDQGLSPLLCLRFNRKTICGL